jgi:hypothetical protein
MRLAAHRLADSEVTLKPLLRGGNPCVARRDKVVDGSKVILMETLKF